jgi:hypothetical protein
MSRVGRVAVALALASGLGVGGAQADSTWGVLDAGLTQGLNQFSNFNPGPGFPTQFTAGPYAGELDLTAGAGSTITYFTSTTPGGLNVNYTDSPFDVKFTYFGAEAGNVNASFGNALLFTSGVDAVLSEKTLAYSSPPLPASPTYLPFSFTTNGFFTCGAAPKTANNGGPIDNGCAGTLGIGFVVINPTVAYAFFQDGDGDFDFDDLVVRIQLLPGEAPPEVPLPPAAILFGSALAAMGLLGMRRRRSTKRA